MCNACALVHMFEAISNLRQLYLFEIELNKNENKIKHLYTKQILLQSISSSSKMAVAGDIRASFTNLLIT